MSSSICASATVLINRPVDDVWEFIDDVGNLDRWMRGISDSSDIQGNVIGKGSTFTSRFSYRRRIFDVNFTITEYDKPKCFGMESSEGPVQYSVMLRLKDENGATRVTNSINTGSNTPPGNSGGGMLSPLLKWGMRRQLSKELGDLKRVIERGE